MISIAAVRTAGKRREAAIDKTWSSPDNADNVKRLAASQANYLLHRGDKQLADLQAQGFEFREKQNDESCTYRKEVRHAYHNYWVQVAIALVIFFNFVVEAIRSQVLPEEGSSGEHVFLAFEYFFSIFFAIEVGVNWYGSWFTRFFVASTEHEHWGWNVFDLVIVSISVLAMAVPDLPGITVLRLFRVFRIARLFEKLESLKKIAEGILNSIPGVLQVMVFLMIVMGIWAVIGVSLYNEDAPREFGTFTKAVYTMVKALMGDFTGINDKLLFDHDRWSSVTFFLSYIFIATLLLMNVVVAVLLDKYLAYEDSVEEGPTVEHPVDVEGLPMVYLKNDGKLHPVRSIRFDQLEKVKHFFQDLSPVTSDEEDSSDSMLVEPISKWNMDKVARWLTRIDFSDYVDRFREHDIDGKKLTKLSIFDIVDLGLHFGNQNKLHYHIQEYLSRHKNVVRKKEEVRKAFDDYDTDQSGFLAKAEFVKAWMSYIGRHDEVCQNFVAQVFVKLDADNSGEVDFEEFKKMRKVMDEFKETGNIEDAVDMAVAEMEEGSTQSAENIHSSEIDVKRADTIE